MKKGVIAILSIFFFLILCLMFILLSPNKPCNDGTAPDSCSSIRPYFCSRGILIENATICGCENVSSIDGEKCVSVFRSEPKNITLRYTLRGRKGTINFAVYKKMADYLSKLSRYIDSDENPTLLDFKLKTVNEQQQRELLLPLVIQIEQLASNKEDQARIAVSLVQNIPFGSSNKTIQFGNSKTEYHRYPYEVLYDMEGICSEKSELMVFLLREIGYGSAFLYYPAENHEAVGIKCPTRESLNRTGYCFIETTGPSIISDDRTEYVGTSRQLSSSPQILKFSEGISLGNTAYEYRDAETLISIRNTLKNWKIIGPLQYIQFKILRLRYGLVNFNEYVF